MTEESKETTITENSTTILKELRRSSHFEGMALSFYVYILNCLIKINFPNFLINLPKTNFFSVF